jgi:hypothetical protein
VGIICWPSSIIVRINKTEKLKPNFINKKRISSIWRKLILEREENVLLIQIYLFIRIKDAQKCTINAYNDFFEHF